MKVTKRLALPLAVLMLLSMFCSSAFAAERNANYLYDSGFTEGFTDESPWYINGSPTCKVQRSLATPDGVSGLSVSLNVQPMAESQGYGGISQNFTVPKEGMYQFTAYVRTSNGLAYVMFPINGRYLDKPLNAQMEWQKITYIFHANAGENRVDIFGVGSTAQSTIYVAQPMISEY